MLSCSLLQKISILLWIAVTVTIVTTHIVGAIRYHSREDSEVGRGDYLMTMTHPAFIITLAVITVAASGAAMMRLKECQKAGTATASEEMLSSVLSFDSL